MHPDLATVSLVHLGDDVAVVNVDDDEGAQGQTGEGGEVTPHEHHNVLQLLTELLLQLTVKSHWEAWPWG